MKGKHGKRKAENVIHVTRRKAAEKTKREKREKEKEGREEK